MTHIISTDECPGCIKKLLFCDPFWTEWFSNVKAIWPTAHIAWGFRGQADQDADFAAGKSKLKWPNSKHNFMLRDDKPNSLALDIFEINPDNGKAVFDSKWCAEVYHWSLSKGYPVQWGGLFETLKDMDHFEIAQTSVF